MAKPCFKIQKFMSLFMKHFKRQTWMRYPVASMYQLLGYFKQLSFLYQKILIHSLVPQLLMWMFTTYNSMLVLNADKSLRKNVDFVTICDWFFGKSIRVYQRTYPESEFMMGTSNAWNFVVNICKKPWFIRGTRISYEIYNKITLFVLPIRILKFWNS